MSHVEHEWLLHEELIVDLLSCWCCSQNIDAGSPRRWIRQNLVTGCGIIDRDSTIRLVRRRGSSDRDSDWSDIIHVVKIESLKASCSIDHVSESLTCIVLREIEVLCGNNTRACNATSVGPLIEQFSCLITGQSIVTIKSHRNHVV